MKSFKLIGLLSLTVLWFSVTANVSADGVRQRIKFARGENSAAVSGAVVRGDRNTYLVGGREGQKMSVKISSAGKNAAFQIRDAASGKLLSGAGETDDATEWSNPLPTTGDYEIIVSGTRGNAEYKLNVSVK